MRAHEVNGVRRKPCCCERFSHGARRLQAVGVRGGGVISVACDAPACELHRAFFTRENGERAAFAEIDAVAGFAKRLAGIGTQGSEARKAQRRKAREAVDAARDHSVRNPGAQEFGARSERHGARSAGVADGVDGACRADAASDVFRRTPEIQNVDGKVGRQLAFGF